MIFLPFNLLQQQPPLNHLLAPKAFLMLKPKPCKSSLIIILSVSCIQVQSSGNPVSLSIKIYFPNPAIFHLPPLSAQVLSTTISCLNCCIAPKLSPCSSCHHRSQNCPFTTCVRSCLFYSKSCWRSASHTE